MAIFPTAFSLRGATQRSALLTKDRDLAATVNGIVSVLLVPGNGLDDAARIAQRSCRRLSICAVHPLPGRQPGARRGGAAVGAPRNENSIPVPAK